MATQLHDAGEQWLLEYVFTEDATKPATFNVGLYDDATAALTDSSDYAAIGANEPATGNYAKQSKSFGTDITMSTVTSPIDVADCVFDTTSTTESVDSYFVTISVQLSDDGSATEHLLWTGSLGGTYDLSNYTQFTVQDVGLSID